MDANELFEIYKENMAQKKSDIGTADPFWEESEKIFAKDLIVYEYKTFGYCVDCREFFKNVFDDLSRRMKDADDILEFTIEISSPESQLPIFPSRTLKSVAHDVLVTLDKLISQKTEG